MKTYNKSQGIQIGFCSMYPAPGIIERVGPDWDWIWIDGQHGQAAGYAEMLAMVRACNLIQRPAYVRVPSHEAGWIGLVLDANASGLIVPQVESAAEARAVVRAAKFPPLGNRSYGGRRPIDFFGRTYSDTANEQVRLICQIESEGALDAVEEIAAVPGVDGLFFGPDDMTLRKGGAMDKPHDAGVIAECVTRVAKACHPHRKAVFTVAMNEAMIRLCVSVGVTHLVCGGDVPFLANGSRTAAGQARTFTEQVGSENPPMDKDPTTSSAY